jgi:hypothetical protein
LLEISLACVVNAVFSPGNHRLITRSSFFSSPPILEHIRGQVSPSYFAHYFVVVCLATTILARNTSHTIDWLKVFCCARASSIAAPIRPFRESETKFGAPTPFVNYLNEN